MRCTPLRRGAVQSNQSLMLNHALRFCRPPWCEKSGLAETPTREGSGVNSSRLVALRELIGLTELLAGLLGAA
jgi:hypothetical protein